MKIIFISIIVISLISCKENKSSDNSRQHLGESYFQFDSVTYFRANNKVNETYVEALLTKENKSPIEKYDVEIISGNYPENTIDMDTSKLVQAGFKKTYFDPGNLPTLRKVFSDKKPSKGFTMSCMPMYRDIILFYFENRLNGIAKICFSCHQYHCAGQKVNTESFGSDEDYNTLGKILNP